MLKDKKPMNSEDELIAIEKLEDLLIASELTTDDISKEGVKHEETFRENSKLDSQKVQ